MMKKRPNFSEDWIEAQASINVNFGRVGHYASKCPYKKTKNRTQETEKTKTNNWPKGKRSNRKSLYAQQDSTASEKLDESSNGEGTSEFVLMAKK